MKHNKLTIINRVRQDYAAVAQGDDSGCLGTSCCGTESDMESLLEAGLRLGYSHDQLQVGLGEANLGLGCGNPQAIADLKKGETVIDLGSGAGFDAFLCGLAVGPEGKIIGIDMTPDMVNKARKNRINLHADNVEFRLGEIEHLPVADEVADVIISNCVINLSVDKQKVLNDAHRVLKPGGRLAISDILNKGELPANILNDPAAYSG